MPYWDNIIDRPVCIAFIQWYVIVRRCLHWFSFFVHSFLLSRTRIRLYPVCMNCGTPNTVLLFLATRIHFDCPSIPTVGDALHIKRSKIGEILLPLFCLSNSHLSGIVSSQKSCRPFLGHNIGKCIEALPKICKAIMSSHLDETALRVKHQRVFSPNIFSWLKE